MDIESEILIAEFMLAEQQGYTLEQVYNQYDFLMQVVEKINGFDGASFRILGTDVKVNYKGRIVARCHTIDLKNSIYGTVVKFIKWYNKQNGYTQ